ncbi:hypothetical protein F4808DRAFT_416446 [Astrocystis sublimbata]|nr:hypothetical protein F4808DRAFT_416446 [Astrocystis sublimbata]
MSVRKPIAMIQQPDTKAEEARDERSIAGREQGECILRRTWNSPLASRRAPKPKSYPPISSIPKMSPERLALASPDNTSAPADTILYLAYGSNLCAETFLGKRGIRPVSQINVSAPAFDLAFDLPGIPFNEPCFANTTPRKIPKPPGFPPAGTPATVPSSSPSPNDIVSTSASAPAAPSNPTWSKGLYGVVYEVTPADYATIIATEGGGQGYHDVLTPCFELPPALHVPEKPPFPELPKPFLAHTLYAPSLPDLPDDPKEPGKDTSDGDNDDDNENNETDARDNDGDKPEKPDPRKLPWLRRLLLPVHRPNPAYAQPSARYLKLIRDGAREHALPDDYQAYLASLQPYTITTLLQQIGRVLFLLTALPFLFLLLGMSRLLADGDGRTPRWFGLATTAYMNLLWIAYDGFFEPLFGDGERTMPERDPGEGEEGEGRIRLVDGSEGGEKNRLLGDW